MAFLCAGHGFQERFLVFLCAGHGFQERFFRFFTKSRCFLRKVTIFNENKDLQLSRLIKRHAPPHTAKPPYRCRAGIYPPTFFSPGPADPIPPEKDGAGRRGNNNTTTRWRRPEAPCHHRVQGSSVNPFGYPPLSDITSRLIFLMFLSSDKADCFTLI